MNTYFFSHARFGIYLSIMNEIKDQKQEILLPDFICESVPNFLMSKKLNIIFYKINLNLKINWSDLKNKLTKNTKILVVVNYFGFPLDLDKSLIFCKNNNLILIEDNTHGYNGVYKGKLLGSFGNYGVTSPRKHIPLRYGGVLYSKKKLNKKNYYKIIYKTSFLSILKFYISNNFLPIKLFIKKIINKEIKSVPNLYENLLDISKCDYFSKKMIKNIDWDLIKNKKSNNFNKWRIYSRKNNLKTLINLDPKDLNPWAFPILVDSDKDLVKWLNWGLNNKVIVFNWPTLHKSISKKTHAYKLSKKIICFSTYISK